MQKLGTKKGKRLGFTLAEVLITLSIIGIVAALTIPTLISSTGNQKYTTGLKKQISILSQALQMNRANNSELTSITGGANAAGNNALAAYFKGQLNAISDNTTGLLILADGTRLQFINSNSVNTVGCTDADTDGLCDAGQGSMSGLPVGLTGAVCPTITTTVAPLVNCMVYVDTNGAKLPNKVSTATATNDIFLLGIDSTGVKSVDATAVTIPTSFATGETGAVSPTTSSVLAITQ